MTYATQSDLETRFTGLEIIQLADPTRSGVADTVIVANALADADAEIDGYLAGRYTLPLDPVPSNLNRIACDIARYRLWKDRASEEVRNRYTDAIRYLERVASGAIPLGVSGAGETPAVAMGGPSHSARARVFDDSSLDGL